MNRGALDFNKKQVERATIVVEESSNTSNTDTGKDLIIFDLDQVDYSDAGYNEWKFLNSEEILANSSSWVSTDYTTGSEIPISNEDKDLYENSPNFQESIDKHKEQSILFHSTKSGYRIEYEVDESNSKIYSYINFGNPDKWSYLK